MLPGFRPWLPLAGGPFPERLHLIMLFSRFCVDYLFLLQHWTAMAGREVASWPTTKNLGLTDGTRHIFEDLLREGERLAGAPKLTVGAENASC